MLREAQQERAGLKAAAPKRPIDAAHTFMNMVLFVHTIFVI